MSEASSAESKHPMLVSAISGNARHSHPILLISGHPARHHARTRVKSSNWHVLALDIPCPARKMAMLGVRVFDSFPSSAREPYRKYQESA